MEKYTVKLILFNDPLTFNVHKWPNNISNIIQIPQLNPYHITKYKTYNIEGIL